MAIYQMTLRDTETEANLSPIIMCAYFIWKRIVVIGKQE